MCLKYVASSESHLLTGMDRKSEAREASWRYHLLKAAQEE